MTQVNKVSRFKPYQFKPGDQVTCEVFPDMVWTVVWIKQKKALIRSAGGSERLINIDRLHRA